MPNTKTNRGLKQDRSKVAGGQTHEISYMREKFGVSTQAVTGAIRAVGNDRKKIEAYLKQK